MDFNKLTVKAQEAVGATQDLARRRGNPEIYPEHLLLALLEQQLPQTLATRAGTAPEALRSEAEEELARKPSMQGAPNLQPRVSTQLEKVLDKAADQAKKLEDDYVSTEHLLLALGVIPRDALLAALKEVRGRHLVNSQDPEGTYHALERVGRDLTDAADECKLGPAIGIASE